MSSPLLPLILDKPQLLEMGISYNQVMDIYEDCYASALAAHPQASREIWDAIADLWTYDTIFSQEETLSAITLLSDKYAAILSKANQLVKELNELKKDHREQQESDKKTINILQGKVNDQDIEIANLRAIIEGHYKATQDLEHIIHVQSDKLKEVCGSFGAMSGKPEEDSKSQLGDAKAISLTRSSVPMSSKPEEDSKSQLSDSKVTSLTRSCGPVSSKPEDDNKSQLSDSKVISLTRNVEHLQRMVEFWKGQAAPKTETKSNKKQKRCRDE